MSQVRFWRRGLLRRMALCLAGAVLLSQMAVAAYACPSLGAALVRAQLSVEPSMGTDGPAQGQTAATPCHVATGLGDLDLPNLCAEYCKHGKQSDHAGSVVVPGVWMSALYVLKPAPVARAEQRPAAALLDALAGAAPPHAILHCVQRT